MLQLGVSVEKMNFKKMKSMKVPRLDTHRQAAECEDKNEDELIYGTEDEI